MTQSEPKRQRGEKAKELFRKMYELKLEAQRNEWDDKNDLLQELFPQITNYEFFRTIFPEGALERKGHPEDKRPNGMITNIVKSYDEEQKKHQRSETMLVFDDLKGFDMFRGRQFVVSNGILYSGNHKSKKNAYELYAFIIDLDDVSYRQIEQLIYQYDEIERIPKPTMIVNSGRGLHVYYVLEEPIKLFPYRYAALNRFKAGLTYKVWNGYTSRQKNKEYQNIFQTYRVPGSLSKLGKNYPIKAYKTGEKVSLEYLNSFIEEEYKVDTSFTRGKSLEYYRVNHPEWYEKRIINGEEPDRIHYNRGMYDKWVKWSEQAKEGSRYHTICCLFVNAYKCNVPFEEVLADALALVPILDRETDKKEPFTESDVMDASKFYHKRFANMRVSTMREMVSFEIPKTPKTKTRKKSQAEHLASIRAFRDDKLGSPDAWRNKDGAPTKQQIVLDWKAEHPDGRKADCIRETGLSKKTVYKWW